MPTSFDEQRGLAAVLEPGGDEPYLVLSDGARPRWAFPTEDRNVFRAAMAVYTPGTARGVAAWYGARLASRAGLGALLPGHRPFVHIRLARALSDVVGVDRVHLAVGSSFDGQRLVIAIIDGLGHVRGFAKVANAEDPSGVRRLRREATVLERLGGRVADIEVPRVLFAGRLDDLEALVLTPIHGRPALNPARLTRRHTDAAAQIFSMRGGTTTIGSHLDTDVLDPDWAGRLDAVREITAAVADIPVPSGLLHGDFAAWNLLEHRRRIGAVDWEQARFDGLPFWDLWHFSVQAAVPARSGASLRAIRRAVRGEGRLADAFNRYAATTGVPVGLAPDVLLVYLVRRGVGVTEQARVGAEDARRGLPFWVRLLDEMLEVLS
jgi:aminoglycoside phosphotransferase (APT) family kinase protein